jgi:alpha-tubulin suppressor-like RCC1 family protein
MGIAYYGIKNNSNYIITTNGKLLEIGRSRRFNSSVPTILNNEYSWSQISGGNEFALIIQSNGTLWSWGRNVYGELGLNTNRSVSSPVQVGSSLWKKVSTGSYYSLAIQSNGTLWSWGDNAAGRLGLSDTTERSSPVQIGTGSYWTQISAGAAHSLAIQSDGTLWAWGVNNVGQLGLNTDTYYSSPVQVGALLWKELYSTSGGAFSLAIQSNGTLWSWGLNDQGQLGLSDQTNRSSPVQIGTSLWKKVACGYKYFSAIQSNGTLWSCGYNYFGQLMLSDRTARSSPVQVGTLSNWSQVGNSRNNSLAIQSNGTLWSCGYNLYGQLGLSDTVYRSSPVQVGNLNVWTQIDPGFQQVSYAIQSNGTLWSWGNNSEAQLGFDTISYRSSASQVGTLSTWSKLPGGSQSSAWSLVIDNSQTLYGFGDNTAWRMNYQQATPYYNNSLTVDDGQLVAFPVPISSNVSSVSSGSECAAFIKTDGTLWAWGVITFGQAGTTFGPNWTSPRLANFLNNNVTSLSISAGSGEDFSLVIQSNGTLWAWGVNTFGVLGLNTSTGSYTKLLSPVQVGALSVWTKISTGQFHSLAIQSNGTLWSWGNNSWGQLGLLDVLSLHRSSPVQVGSSLWKEISAGGWHCLAIQSNGTLWSWGYNFNGQLGLSDNTQRSSPVQVGALSVWTKISNNINFSLALQSNGTLWSWGNNGNGALGLSNTTNRSSPVQVGSLSSWSKISASSFASFAIQSDGTLWSWGYNVLGQLGLSNTTDRSSPVQVGALLWKEIFGGYAHTLAIQSNGTLWSWGSNSFGQLGLSDRTNRSSPIQVGSLSNWTTISTPGQNSSFATLSNSILYVWGNNSSGQLGNEPGTIYSPIQIAAESDWSQVVYGTNFALALRRGGQLYAWGNNSFGQLGQNNQINYSSPVQIGSLTNWNMLVSGDTFSAALKNDGTLWAWGNNSYGQLGQGDYTHRSSPVQVGTISQYTSVFALGNTLLANLL